MAKDTKEVISKAFLVLATQEEPLTLTRLSELSGVMRPTIHANFGKDALRGILDHLYQEVDDEIKSKLFEHDPEELPPEIFIDIVIPVLYAHRDTFRVLLTSPQLNMKSDFSQMEQFSKNYFPWLKARFEKISKKTDLGPSITGQSLFEYWTRWLNSIWILWLSSDIPDEPQVFKKKLLFLLKASMMDLVYKEFE